MPKKNHRLDSAFFYCQKSRFSAFFSLLFMPNLNGGFFSALIICMALVACAGAPDATPGVSGQVADNSGYMDDELFATRCAEIGGYIESEICYAPAGK